MFGVLQQSPAKDLCSSAASNYEDTRSERLHYVIEEAPPPMNPRKIPMKGVRIHDLYNLRDQRTRDLWASNDPENARRIRRGRFRLNEQ